MQRSSRCACGVLVVLAGVLVLAGCYRSSPSPSVAATSPAPTAQAVGDDAAALFLPDLMAFLVDPAAGVVLSAADAPAGSDREPLTAEAWQAVVDAAVQLAQAGDLLAQPALVVGRADWRQWTAALRESAAAGGAAAARHDAADLSAAGARLLAACQACHARYASAIAAASALR